MKVKFNSSAEFLEEISKDKDMVERKIVRVTRLFASVKALPVKELSVVATAVVDSKIIRLDRPVGQILTGAFEDSEVQRQADRLVDTLCNSLSAVVYRSRAGNSK